VVCPRHDHDSGDAFVVERQVKSEVALERDFARFTPASDRMRDDSLHEPTRTDELHGAQASSGRHDRASQPAHRDDEGSGGV
jgi:hypothetical protein